MWNKKKKKKGNGNFKVFGLSNSNDRVATNCDREDWKVRVR